MSKLNYDKPVLKPEFSQDRFSRDTLNGTRVKQYEVSDERRWHFLLTICYALARDKALPRKVPKFLRTEIKWDKGYDASPGILRWASAQPEFELAKQHVADRTRT